MRKRVDARAFVGRHVRIKRVNPLLGDFGLDGIYEILDADNAPSSVQGLDYTVLLGTRPGWRWVNISRNELLSPIEELALADGLK